MFKKFLKTVYVTLAIPAGVAVITAMIAFDPDASWYKRLLSGLVAMSLFPLALMFYAFVNMPGIVKNLDA